MKEASRKLYFLVQLNRGQIPLIVVPLDRGSRVKDRESRNEEFWNIHELESAIHLSRKEQ